MNRTPNRPKWNQAPPRQTEGDYKDRYTKKNEKKITSFLGAIQYLSKYIENLSAQTDILRKLFKKTKRMEVDTGTQGSVQQLEKN